MRLIDGMLNAASRTPYGNKNTFLQVLSGANLYISYCRTAKWSGSFSFSSANIISRGLWYSSLSSFTSANRNISIAFAIVLSSFRGKTKKMYPKIASKRATSDFSQKSPADLLCGELVFDNKIIDKFKYVVLILNILKGVIEVRFITVDKVKYLYLISGVR